jgi:hypothetical protein
MSSERRVVRRNRTEIEPKMAGRGRPRTSKLVMAHSAKGQSNYVMRSSERTNKAGRTLDPGSIERAARPLGLQTESIPEHPHSHSHSHPHSPPSSTEPLSFYNFNYLGPLPREYPTGPTLPPSLPPNTPTMASAMAPIPRGAASKPRPMSLPPTSYSSSYSGTSAERPRQHVEQPLASAQRHSQRGLEPPKQRTTNRILGDYTLSKTLGAGSMGKVKLAHHNVTGEKVRMTLPLSFLPAFLHSRSVFSFLPALSLGFKHMSSRSLSSSPNCSPCPMLFSQSDGVIHRSDCPCAISLVFSSGP